MITNLRHLFARIAPGAYEGYLAHFSAPVKFSKGDWFVNERIVELVFAHKHLDMDGEGKRLLEFGCTRSVLAMQVVSFGYHVVGVDLRPYPLTHPRFRFYQTNLLQFEDAEGFDFVTAISTIEHVGMSAYGETGGESDLRQVAAKLEHLLKPGGKLIVTVPIGERREATFFRSFAPNGILSLFSGGSLELIDNRFFCREELKFWHPCSAQQAAATSNSESDRGPSGVNGVGCFAWQKKRSLS